MIIAGIGCRKGTPAMEIEAAIAAALAGNGIAARSLGLIATAKAKETERGITAAASALGVELVLVPQSELAAVASRTLTQSKRVQAHMGVPSVAEAAALAAGGPNARLLAARTVLGPATCALALSGETS
jgi:cobalt-precorrin 5A hydrolase